MIIIFALVFLSKRINDIKPAQVIVNPTSTLITNSAPLVIINIPIPVSVVPTNSPAPRPPFDPKHDSYQYDYPRELPMELRGESPHGDPFGYYLKKNR